jgi:cytidine deaminase
LGSSDDRRLSVAVIDVLEGNEQEFRGLAAAFADLIARKQYGTTDVVRDEAMARRYYSVRYWADIHAAQKFHGDPDVQTLTLALHRIAKITLIVNGVRRAEPVSYMGDERRQVFETERRTGYDRRLQDLGSPTGVERRRSDDRRLGPRRLRERSDDVDLIGAARRAREHAEAAFSHFKVGAALQTGDGTVVSGCNVENATYGLTVCAERVAMFKALSEGHRVFTRIAIVADTEAPTPPCGACRQILWEFGGNIEVHLANLKEPKGVHYLKDLLPLPFDARLL